MSHYCHLLSWRKADRDIVSGYGEYTALRRTRQGNESTISRLTLVSKDNLGPLRKKA